MELGFKVSHMCFIAHSIASFNEIFCFYHLYEKQGRSTMVEVGLL